MVKGMRSRRFAIRLYMGTVVYQVHAVSARLMLGVVVARLTATLDREWPPEKIEVCVFFAA